MVALHGGCADPPADVRRFHGTTLPACRNDRCGFGRVAAQRLIHVWCRAWPSEAGPRLRLGFRAPLGMDLEQPSAERLPCARPVHTSLYSKPNSSGLCIAENAPSSMGEFTPLDAWVIPSPAGLRPPSNMIRNRASEKLLGCFLQRPARSMLQARSHRSIGVQLISGDGLPDWG
jgi:hypothetical protein